MTAKAQLANPYVGLRPFESADSLYYFGRREQTAELLERLYDTRLVAVVGSSGCGKSSLIRAGLIPSLLGGFLVEQRDKWRTACLRPNGDPLLALASSLCDAVDPNTSDSMKRSLLNRLVEYDTPAVIDYLTSHLDNQTNLLLLIDQFEEIFAFRGVEEEEDIRSLTRDRRQEFSRRRIEAAGFVDQVLELTRCRTLPIYAVITMRSDYLGDCDVFYGLPEAIYPSLYLVPRLMREQLRQAIEGPVLLNGQRMSARLLDQLLNELGDRFDRLPILQHALLRTWDMWQRQGTTGPLDLDAYETAGALENALSLHAEEALENSDLVIAAKVFKCLTETDASRRRIRRPSHVSELAAVAGASPEKVLAVVDRFRQDGRDFLQMSAGATLDDPLIQISHESLIRQWDRLKQWVDDESRSSDQYVELVRRARNQGALLQNSELQQALAWRRESNPTKAWAQRYSSDETDFDRTIQYLEASEAESDRITWSVRLLIVLALASFLKYWFEDAIFFLFEGVPNQDDTPSIINLPLAGAFAALAWYAKLARQWPFLIAIVMYAADTVWVAYKYLPDLMNDPAKSMLIFGIHVWVLYTLADGFRACRELRRVSLKR